VDFVGAFRADRLLRDIQICVVVTCYNEDAEELRETLHGLANNMEALEDLGISWRQVQVCVIIDGLSKASESMLVYLQDELKIYDPALVRTQFHGSDVTMHLFEKTIQLSRHATQREYYLPLQLMLGLKARNGGKLNTHLWFFSAICRQLRPEFVMVCTHTWWWCVRARSDTSVV